MAYTDAITYIHARLAAMSVFKVIRDGSPTFPQALPLAFTEAADGTRVRGSQVTVNKYYIDLSVLVDFQDNVLAETQIGPFINSVPAAVETLRTRTALSGIQIVGWVADHYVFGDPPKTTRRVRFRCEVKDEGPTGSGI